MKRVTALLMTLALMALMALPAFAQGDTGPIAIEVDLDEQNNSGISGTVVLEETPDDKTQIGLQLGARAEGLVVEGVEYPSHIHAGQCPEPGAIMYPLDPVVFDPATREGVADQGLGGGIAEIPIRDLLTGKSAIDVHLYSDPSVSMACATLPLVGGDKHDDQQSGGDDDQQVPDGQQSVGGNTATKTFQLTLNGMVPEDDEFLAFYVLYAEKNMMGSDGDSFISVAKPMVLCGAPGFEESADEAACKGKGRVYTVTMQFPLGTEIEYGFYREGKDMPRERFHGGTETITADMTNAAWYTFGKDTGAGDDQQSGYDTQDDLQDDDPDVAKDIQDDQQGEMPEAMPYTGMGGLVPGPQIPFGNAVAGLAMLLGAGYAVLGGEEYL